MTTDLESLTHRLLWSTGEAKPCFDQLVVVRLSQIIEIDLHPSFFLDTKATFTGHSKAVSLTTAAQCAEDVEASRMFGVYHAVSEGVAKGHAHHDYCNRVLPERVPNLQFTYELQCNYPKNNH